MITGIQIDDGCFAKDTEFQFFKQSMDRFAVVFGRNGSGKSSIGRAFASLDTDSAAAGIPEASEKALSAEGFVLVNEVSVMLPEGAKPHVHVFNEDFVQQNVQFVNGGLGTVALIGPQGSVQTEIQAVEKQIDDAKKLLVPEEDLQDADDLAKNCLTALENKLRDRWAKDDGKIRGNKVSSRVPNEVDHLSQIDTHGKTVSQLALEYDDKSREFYKIYSQSAITEVLSMFNAETLIGKIDAGLLARALPIPTGVGVARLVAENLERHSNYVHAARQEFQDAEVQRCPFCLQTVSPEYRSELLTAIADSIDDDAKKAVKELQDAKLPPQVINVPTSFQSLNAQLVKDILKQTSALNAQIEALNVIFERKKQNLYTEVTWDSTSLEKHATDLEMLLSEIGAERQIWNDRVKKAQQLKAELLELNKRFARAECTQEFSDYKSALEAAASLLEDSRDRKSVLEPLEIRRTQLLAELKEVKLGADQINQHLGIIFADESRLKLVPASDEKDDPLYQVLCRGRAVPPERLSVGERNVLALCYFFAKLKEHEGDTGSLDKTLVVLDDPVSSVDVENRVGIHVYLERRFGELLRSYPGARVLVLTHDLTAARHFEKSGRSVVDQLFNRELGHSKKNKPSIRAWVLRSTQGGGGLTHSLDGVDAEGHARTFGKGLEEYRNLLVQVWKFASTEEVAGSGIGDISLPMGNVMRRVLEAFGTFIYDAESIASDKLQQAYHDAKSVDLNLALGSEFRYVLHGESHASEAVASLSVFASGVTYNFSQLQSTARRLLALMYGLQPDHIAAYLPEAVAKIEEWEETELGIAKTVVA